MKIGDRVSFTYNNSLKFGKIANYVRGRGIYKPEDRGEEYYVQFDNGASGIWISGHKLTLEPKS